MNGKSRLLALMIFVLSSLFLLSACNSSVPLQSDITDTSVVESYESSELESTEDAMAEYKKISPQEAYEMMNEEEVIILDVRTLEEYNQGHIKDSVLLPVDEIKSGANSVLTDKSAIILVYCRSGNRSFYATNDLLELGYSNVYDFGGINSWPYDIVS